MHGVFLETRACKKTVVLPLQMCIARFSCFLQQAVTGYRLICCTAVLNPFVFVTVSAFTFRPTERPDKTEDREERETSVICFKKYPHQESLGLASTWMLTIVVSLAFVLKQAVHYLRSCNSCSPIYFKDIISAWRSTKGINKPIFISRIALLSTIFQDIAPNLIIKTFVLNNGDKRQNHLASSSLSSV